MVGGAVVTKEYAESIGAYYGKDAVDAVSIAKTIVKVK
jgi:methanogenic corrinoid protein MtbC1